MGIELPGELQWVAKWVVGAGDWPEGDETAMRRVAHAWDALATVLDSEIEADADGALRDVLAALDSGKTHDALADYRRQIAGPDGSLPALIKRCQSLADSLNDGANDIEHTKMVIIGALVIFAAQALWALGVAATGIGAPAAAAAEVAARVATQITIRMAIRQLIQRMLTRAAAKAAARAALKGVGWGILQSGGVDLGARIVQIADGHRDGLSAKDWNQVGLGTLTGTVAGAIGGGLGASGLGSNAVDAASSRLGKAAIQTGVDGAVGTAAYAAGTAATVPLGGNFEFGAPMVTSSVANGAIFAVGAGAHHNPDSAAPSIDHDAAQHLDLSSPQDIGTKPSPTIEAERAPAATTETKPSPSPTAVEHSPLEAPRSPAQHDVTTAPASTGTEAVRPDHQHDSPSATTADMTSRPTTHSDASPIPTQPPAHTDAMPSGHHETTPPPQEQPSASLTDSHSSGTRMERLPDGSTLLSGHGSLDIETILHPPSPEAPRTLDTPTVEPDAPPLGVNAPASTPHEAVVPRSISDVSDVVSGAPTSPSHPNTTAVDPVTSAAVADGPSIPTTSSVSPSSTLDLSAPAQEVNRPSAPSHAVPADPPQAGPPASTAVPPAAPRADIPTAARPEARAPQAAVPAPASTPRSVAHDAGSTPARSLHESELRPQASELRPESDRPTTTIPERRPPREDSSVARPHDSHQPPRDPGAPAQHPAPREAPHVSEARPEREHYRQQADDDSRLTSVTPRGRSNEDAAYDVHRFTDNLDDPVALISIQVHLSHGDHISPQELQQVLESAQLGADRAFNSGERLLSGDRLLVDIVHTEDPAAAHLHINVDHAPTGPNTWHPNDPPDVLADHIRHQLGLPTDAGHTPGLDAVDLRHISDDLARANTPSRFQDLPQTRVVGNGRLNHLENPAFQAAVEDALRDGNRFLVGADPRTNPYGQLINDGGPENPGRSNNCVEQALAAISSFHGDPQVGVPRWADVLADGTLDRTGGEEGGLERATEWLGGEWQNFDHQGKTIQEQFDALHQWIAHLGPGSSALIVNEWHARDVNTGELRYHPDGSPVVDGSHATVIVYPYDASGPVWWDPQQRLLSDTPPAYMSANSSSLWFMTNGPDGGIDSARTASDAGASGTVSGTHLPDRSTVPDTEDRVRVGLSEDADARGDRQGDGTRAGELRDQRPDRDSDSAFEPSPARDRADVRRSDPERTTDPGQPGLPAPVAREHPAHTGRSTDDRVPARSPVDGATPRTDHLAPIADRQAHPVLPTDRHHLGERSGLGRDAQPGGRDLAGARDVRVLNPFGAAPNEVPTPRSAQVPDIAPPGHTEPGGPDRDPHERPNERDPHSSSEGSNSSRDNPTPPGMYRGDDGLLHRPGDRADSYRDPDGRWHRLGDREGTYRDRAFQLRDGSGWVSDPAVREDIAFLADKGPAQAHEVANPEIRSRLDELAGEATRQDRDRAAVAEVVKAHMREFGVDKIDQLSENKLAGFVKDHEGRIVNDPVLSDQEKLAKLERLHEMRDNARDYNRLGTEKVLTSKEMGGLGGIAHVTERPEAVLLTPFENAIDGRDTFDVTGFISHPPTLIVDECKGGTSQLGAADTEKGRAQQGSREYAERTAAIEKNLQRLLSETPEQMRERGLDPNSPEGQQFLKAREQLLRAHADGTLQVEYNLVHVSRDGTINVAQFNIERDGQPFSPELLGGIDKSRAYELVTAQEREQHIAQAIEAQRARLLESLDPRDRDVVQNAVERALEAVDPAELSQLRAQAIEAIEKFRETLGQDVGQVSREILKARQQLEQAQALEVLRGTEALNSLNLDPHLKQVAAELLRVDVNGRDRGIAAGLDSAHREVIAALKQHVLDARDAQSAASARAVEQALEQAKQLVWSQEQVPGLDMARLLEAHHLIEHVEQVQRIERENNANVLNLMKAAPEHAQEVLQALEIDRTDAIGQVRDAVTREVVQQHNLLVEQNPALRIAEGRESSFDAKAYLLCLEHTPSRFDRDTNAFVYELPGREPIHVPYDSRAAHLARASQAIQRGLSIDHAALIHLARISQAAPAHEAVRTVPTADELRVRRHHHELARERGLQRER
ncbi:toxin glutamine deamidase domain-containing protein [Nocardia sp. R7R-8]|uniref:toxin glutamine deamidase domain-containing protein n=1 Tax=Nocardia sp. R7R-8 TaxID=3459304 RepID=UPI00403DE53F